MRKGRAKMRPAAPEPLPRLWQAIGANAQEEFYIIDFIYFMIFPARAYSRLSQRKSMPARRQAKSPIGGKGFLIAEWKGILFLLEMAESTRKERNERSDWNMRFADRGFCALKKHSPKNTRKAPRSAFLVFWHKAVEIAFASMAINSG